MFAESTKDPPSSLKTSKSLKAAVFGSLVPKVIAPKQNTET
jgi:hypothetical protein